MYHLSRIFNGLFATISFLVMKRTSVRVAGKPYRCRVLRRVVLPPSAPRLIIVSYMHSPDALQLVLACIRSIKRFTAEAHEIWIVDNKSRFKYVRRLMNEEGLNLLLIRDDPGEGSVANGIAVEAAIQQFGPEVEFCMTMHMDTIVCRDNWLSYLMSKLSNQVKVSGVRMDKVRSPDGVAHVLGMLFDLKTFRRFGMTVMPDLPRYDVGDLVTREMRRNGYDVFCCSNSYNQTPSERRNILLASGGLQGADHAFDEKGNVIFMHLGRGSRKVLGEKANGASVQEWLQFAQKSLRIDCEFRSPT